MQKSDLTDVKSGVRVISPKGQLSHPATHAMVSAFVLLLSSPPPVSAKVPFLPLG